MFVIGIRYKTLACELANGQHSGPFSTELMSAFVPQVEAGAKNLIPFLSPSNLFHTLLHLIDRQSILYQPPDSQRYSRANREAISHLNKGLTLVLHPKQMEATAGREENKLHIKVFLSLCIWMPSASRQPLMDSE